MAVRKIVARLQAGIAITSIAILALTAAQVAAEEPTLAEQLQQAERILIGTPEKDVDVAGGEQFLVEIDRVLRGNGQKGKLARIVQSGDATKHPKYAAKKQYLFLLKENKGGEGWVSLLDVSLPVSGGKVRNATGGKAAEDISLEDLQDLIASNPVSKTKTAPRTSTEGRWIVVICQPGTDLLVLLVDVAKVQDQLQAKLVSASKILSAATLKSSEVNAETVQLVFDADGRRFEFQGRLDSGTVLGSIAVDQQFVLPARLVATEAKTLKGEEAQPSAGREDFVKKQEQDDSFAAFEQFIKKFPESPLVFDAYRQLLNEAKKKGLKQPQVQELAENYLKFAQGWGTRLELKALVDIGVILARNEFQPEMAMKYLAAAESKFTPQTVTAWKSQVLVVKARLLISTGKEAEGVALLKPLHAESPFDPEITYTLAQQAEKAKQTDEALALYAEIMVLPMLQRMLQQQWSREGNKLDAGRVLPGVAVERLWKAKHGSEKGLEAYLNEIYEHKIVAFARDKTPRKPGTGTRVALCELFTGARCPPCVGADVATAGLEATFPQSDVIVLRYHQHIPGPDPLANDDARERFEAYYQGQGTPTVALNGKMVDGAGGGLMEAEPFFKRLRDEIDLTLREKIALKLDLSANAKDGVLSLSAKAAGLDKFPDDVHLRLVLAEDKIEFTAANGIRLHEMVVRSMPGGPDGVAPKDGRLEFNDKLDLAKLKQSLTKYLGKVETQMGTEFEEKPLAFKALHLVAFLQNDATQEVLQAASIPVAGTLSGPQDDAESKPAKDKPAKEDNKKPE